MKHGREMAWAARGAPVRRSQRRSVRELSVIVLLLATLAGVFFDRVRGLRAIAERVAVGEVVAGLREALGTVVALDVAKDDKAALAQLPGSNPMDLLAVTPSDYVGLRQGPAGVAAGHWYFNPVDHDLVYRVRATQGFRSTLSGPSRIRYRVVGRYQPWAGHQLLVGLDLVVIEPYRWR